MARDKPGVRGGHAQRAQQAVLADEPIGDFSVLVDTKHIRCTTLTLLELRDLNVIRCQAMRIQRL